MERTVLRILGKKGRTTIPWPIRAELDFCPGDVLLFEADPPGRVVITRTGGGTSRRKWRNPTSPATSSPRRSTACPCSQQYRLLAALLADFHLQ